MGAASRRSAESAKTTDSSPKTVSPSSHCSCSCRAAPSGSGSLQDRCSAAHSVGESGNGSAVISRLALTDDRLQETAWAMDAARRLMPPSQTSSRPAATLSRHSSPLPRITSRPETAASFNLLLLPPLRQRYRSPSMDSPSGSAALAGRMAVPPLPPHTRPVKLSSSWASSSNETGSCGRSRPPLPCTSPACTRPAVAGAAQPPN